MGMFSLGGSGDAANDSGDVDYMRLAQMLGYGQQGQSQQQGQAPQGQPQQPGAQQTDPNFVVGGSTSNQNSAPQSAPSSAPSQSFVTGPSGDGNLNHDAHYVNPANPAGYRSWVENGVLRDNIIRTPSGSGGIYGDDPASQAAMHAAWTQGDNSRSQMGQNLMQMQQQRLQPQGQSQGQPQQGGIDWNAQQYQDKIRAAMADPNNNPQSISSQMRQWGIPNSSLESAMGWDQNKLNSYFSPVFGQQQGQQAGPGLGGMAAGMSGGGPGQMQMALAAGLRRMGGSPQYGPQPTWASNPLGRPSIWSGTGPSAGGASPSIFTGG